MLVGYAGRPEITPSPERAAPTAWLAAEAARGCDDRRIECFWIVERGQNRITCERQGVGSRRHTPMKRSRPLFASRGPIS